MFLNIAGFIIWSFHTGPTTPAANQDVSTPQPSDCDKRTCSWILGVAVCDNMGVTHNSQCDFEIAQCKIPQLKVVSQGPCDGKVHISMKKCYKPTERVNRVLKHMGYIENYAQHYTFLNQYMLAEAWMFLNLIHIFLNSHPIPTPNTFFSWSKLSFGRFQSWNFEFFVVFGKKFTPNLSLDIFTKLFL